MHAKGRITSPALTEVISSSAEISVDCDEPDCAYFTCQLAGDDTGGYGQQGGYAQQGGYGQQGGYAQQGQQGGYY